MMQARQAETIPGIVSVEQGQVILDGPNGVAVAMTPEVAAETGRRLIAGAAEAGRHDPAPEDPSA